MNKNAFQYISDKAIIGSNADIGPFCYIDEDVVIGDNCWIGPNVSIFKGTRIGNNCKIFPGAVLGAIPQDLKYGGEDSLLIIGDNVTVREFCTLNRATRATYQTIVEDQCLLMAYTHVAHDCIIKKGSVLANNVNLAGHVEIGPYSLLGGLVAVQQFVNIGTYSMIAGASLVRKNVPPYIRAAFEPLAYIGVNSIGLKRKGFEDERIRNIKEMYRIIYSPGTTMSEKLQRMESEFRGTRESEVIGEFIRASEKGVIGRKRNQNHRE